MSLIVPRFDDSVVVRSGDAEVVGRAPTAVRLLADSSATGGALSTIQVALTDGADGARPHRHDLSAELSTFWTARRSCCQTSRSSPPSAVTW